MMNAQTQQKSGANVVALQPARLPMDGRLAKEYDLTSTQWRVLSDQIFPNAKTVEAVLMALEYCRARNLDIYKRLVHIVPMWDNQRRCWIETVWPGISEIRTTAHRTGQYAGCDETEFGPEVTEAFEGRVKENGNWIDKTVTVTFPQWAKVTVYKLIKNHKVPYTAKVFWREAYATQGKSDLPNSMWCKRVYGQLDKCAEAAALRKAFPEEIGNEYAAEEMHGQIIEHDPVEPKGPAHDTPPSPPPPAEILAETSPVEEPEAAQGDDGNEKPAATRDEIHSRAESLTPPDKGPPPAPVDHAPEPEPEDAGELIAKAQDWFDVAKTADDLVDARDNFRNLHGDDLSEDDMSLVENAYLERLEQIEPNTLRAG